MQWLFARKKKPPLDSSASTLTSKPTSPPIDKKITFSASLVSTDSSPSEDGVSSPSGNETQVAQNTHPGSIYKTGAGSKIPETPEQKSSEQQQVGSNAFSQIAQKKPNEVVRMTYRIPFGNPSVSPSDNTTNSENTDSVIDLLTGNAVSQIQLAQINKERQEEAMREAEAKALAAAEAKAKQEEEEKAKALADAAAKAKQEEEERAKALAAKALEEERARQEAEAEIKNITPTDENETDEQKQETLLNKLCNDILDNLDTKGIAEDLKNRIINELLEDFSSNQYYNATNTTTSNNTNDSTSEKQKSIAPTREPTTPEKYTAKLTPKTYYGVGIQTELVREDNKSPYLNITQFYDDSGFKSELKDKYPKIETNNQNIKITAIECDWDGNGTKAYYSIDEIFIKCRRDEMTFNLKLCDIFRNLTEKELKLKFSIEGGLQDQDLTIKKSVFTKEATDKEYKNIKNVTTQQTTGTPSRAPSDPQILSQHAKSVLG